MDETGTEEETKNLKESHPQKAKKTHLDGGFGWVVVAACFMVHMLQIGYLRAFGLLFVRFLDELKAPASLTSTVMGIQSAIFSLTSLIVLSVLIDYWSIRGYAMIGAFLSASGVSLSYFAQNIEFLIFSQSVLIGVGNAFTYGPGIVLLGRYFRKRLALANSIANAGVSAGAIIVPIIIPSLIDEYGFRGGLLNLGGILAQVIVCAGLYRDPGKPTEEDQEVNVEDFKSLESFYSLPEHIITREKGPHSTPGVSHTDRDHIYIKNPDVEKGKHSYRERTLSNLSHRSDTIKQLNSSRNNNNTLTPFLSTENGHHQPRNRHISESHSIVDSLSRSRMLLYASNPNLVYASVVDLQSVKNAGEANLDNQKIKSNPLSKLKSILDVSLFKNPVFWIIAGFTPLSMCGSAIAAAYIPALGEEIGLEASQTSLLLTISGALDIFSRLVPGILAELKIIRVPHMVAISLFTLGIVFQFVMFFNNFTLMIVLSSLYGILGGVYFSLLSVVVIELMGFDNFTKVFGFVQVFHGASAAIFYPVLGGLRDITGTYVTCFQFLGASCLAGSIILLLEPLARRRHEKLLKVDKKKTYSKVPVGEKKQISKTDDIKP